MSHLAWIALNAFRPTTGGPEMIVEAAVAITSERLELRFHEHAAILEPTANQINVQTTIPVETLDEYKRSGLWADLAVGRTSIASFDRLVASKIEELLQGERVRKLEVFGLDHDRELIAEQAPAISSFLNDKAFSVESFAGISRRFLIGAAIPTVHTTSRAFARNQNNMVDLFRIITGNINAKGLAA